jgi:hypothetical protein
MSKNKVTVEQIKALAEEWIEDNAFLSDRERVGVHARNEAMIGYGAEKILADLQKHQEQVSNARALSYKVFTKTLDIQSR